MMKKIMTFILAIVAATILVLVIFFSFKGFTSSKAGTINITLYDINDNLIKEVDASYSEGENLVDIIKNNFENVGFEDSQYGPFLYAIEDINTKEDSSIFLEIFKDNISSSVGISQIEFDENTTIQIKVSKIEW